MIVNQKVKIKLSSSNMKWFKKKGYDVKHKNDIIEVDSNDLMPTSRVVVKAICDICGKEYKIQYIAVSCGKLHSCGDMECIKKMRENKVMKIYGVKNVFSEENIKLENAKNFKNNYGVGSEKHEAYVQKRYETNLKRCGNKKGYVDTKETHSKRIRTMFKNFNEAKCQKDGKKIVSKNQVHLCEMLDGVLNYKFEVNNNLYYGDIALVNDKIVIEYDGTGHRIYRKEDENNLFLSDIDLKKDNVMISFGWNIIHLKCNNSKINKDVLITLINVCKQLFVELNEHVLVADFINQNVYSKRKY